MKITSLEMANVKRVKAVRIEPTENGLTVIGGRNGQGKTSILDAIAFALGGERYRPTKLKRDGAVGDSFIHIETDDGLIIDRKGVNSSLSVTDATGKKGGQALLDKVISKLAIDLPKFMNASSADKAKTLLDLLGIGDTLSKLDREEKAKYDQRTAVGRLADSKKKAAEEMEWYEDAPDEPFSAAEAVKEYEAILARNGLREKARQTVDIKTREYASILERIKELQAQAKKVAAEIDLAHKDEGELEDTTLLQRKIDDTEEINRQVRVNKERTDKLAEAAGLKDEYDSLTTEIEKIRSERIKLLDGADLPLPGLSVENGELNYKGAKWDCMSGAQQLIVACAIVSKLNPECKFVLLDKLEQLDLETLEEFDKWLKKQGLQCIATRVSTGGECSIIIDDGEVVGETETVEPKKDALDEEFGDY